MPGESIGRSTRRYKRLVRELRARGRPCILCGQRIDYQLHPWHRHAFTAHHLKSWRDYPHLREDPANLDAAHRSCNSKAGADAPLPELGSTSCEW